MLRPGYKVGVYVAMGVVIIYLVYRAVVFINYLYR